MLLSILKLEGKPNVATDNTVNNQDLSLGAVSYAVFLCIIFGANVVAIKYSFSGLGVFTTAGIRFSIAAVALFCWAKATRMSLIVKKDQFPHMAILSIAFVIQLSLFNLGLNKSHASRAILLINLLPFFVLFLAHYFIPNDRITKRKLVGICLGFIGIVFVFLEKKGLTSEAQLGDLIILVATLVWACDTVYRKRILMDIDPLQLVFYPMMFSVPFFFLEAFIWDDPMLIHLDGKVLASLAYQSLITASFGFVAWSYLLQRHGAVALSSFTFIMPIVGVLVSNVILIEPVTIKIVLSLVFITSGIVVLHFKSKKPTLPFPPVAEM